MKVAFNLPFTVFKEGKSFVAYTYTLDLSSSGKSLEQAQSRLIEAIEILFEELNKKGTLEEVLLDLGWEKSNKSWLPPIQVSHEIKSLAFAA